MPDHTLCAVCCVIYIWKGLIDMAVQWKLNGWPSTPRADPWKAHASKLQDLIGGSWWGSRRQRAWRKHGETHEICIWCRAFKWFIQLIFTKLCTRHCSGWWRNSNKRKKKELKSLCLHEVYALVGDKDKSKINKYNIWYVGGRSSWKCGYELFVSTSHQERFYWEDDIWIKTLK